MYLISFIYLYLLLGLYLIINNHKIPRLYLGLLIFFTFKWIFNYRKCTFSRIECIVRNVEKEEGYLYRLLETIVDISQKPFLKPKTQKSQKSQKSLIKQQIIAPQQKKCCGLF